MAEHYAEFKMPWCELGNSDVTFKVSADDDKLGELKVSRGAVVWYGKGKQAPRKLDWTTFAAVMKKHGHKSNERRRPRG